jgi:hypothetical protein
MRRLLAEDARRGVRGVERAHQMYLDDLLEGVDAHLVEDRIAQDAGVVHHAIELAERIDRLLDDLAGGHGFRDRFEIRDGRAALLPDLLDHLLGRRGVAASAVSGAAGIVDHHLGAFGRAQQRDFAADAAPGAGDDDDFVLQ